MLLFKDVCHALDIGAAILLLFYFYETEYNFQTHIKHISRIMQIFHIWAFINKLLYHVFFHIDIFVCENIRMLRIVSFLNKRTGLHVQIIDLYKYRCTIGGFVELFAASSPAATSGLSVSFKLQAFCSNFHFKGRCKFKYLRIFLYFFANLRGNSKRVILVLKKNLNTSEMGSLVLQSRQAEN